MREKAINLNEPDMIQAESKWEMDLLAQIDDQDQWSEESEKKEQKFIIDGDRKADWALRVIAEEKQEYDRIQELAKAQREEIGQREAAAERRYHQRTAYLRSLLCCYFEAVPHRKTKTRESYRLLSGSLILNLPKPKPVYEEQKLIQYLKDNDMADLVKIEEKAKWGEFKKILDLSQGAHPVIKDTGELVKCIRIEETPAEFKVEV